MRHSQVQQHGRNSEYYRTGIPAEVAKCIEIAAGTTVVWNILDDNQILLKFVKL